MNRIYIHATFEVRASSGNQGLDRRPRQYPDGTGYTTPVSMKSALRGFVEKKDSPLWLSLAAELGLDPACYQIAERNSRGFAGEASPQENYRQFFRLSWEEKKARYVDLRWFGGTHLLEDEKDKAKDKPEAKPEDKAKDKPEAKVKEKLNKYAAAGGIYLTAAESVCPVQIETQTLTCQAIKELKGDQERGMAPDAYCVVRHGVYVVTSYTCATRMHTSGCTEKDVQLYLRLLRHLWEENPSVTRNNIRWLSLFAIEHKKAYSTCPEYLIDAALRPRAKKELPTSLEDYEIPRTLPENLLARVAGVRDLLLD